MEELLEKLLEAEVLTEETKQQISEAFAAKLEEKVEQAKKDAEEQVRLELTEQWVQERDALVEALDSKVNDFLEVEMDELKGDIEKFRDLEAEYAERVVENKKELRKELKSDMKELVEKIDAFLEIRLNEEMQELREDIEEQKQNLFGRKIFEAYKEEFLNGYGDEEGYAQTVADLKARLSEAEETIEDLSHTNSKMVRKDKMQEVLGPLQGRAKEVMEAILRNVSTDQLEEGYNTFIGRVLRETEGDDAEVSSEKESKVLAEDVEGEVQQEAPLEEAVLVTGDAAAEKGSESKQINESDDDLNRLRRIAGIID